ncbi:MAG: twin-arginine translocation signal domain-containing protein, partial [Akkermansiaceae bacterium]
MNCLLNRRHFLRGAGVAIALPMLESMPSTARGKSAG